ncbi:MAG: hypothetical protein PVF56_04435 [Desulfobacterales bacterium]|jgi:hypothetical protein
MKNIAIVGLIVLSALAIATSSKAESCTLKYKLTPGQKWICIFSSKNESSFMGKKNINQSKHVYEYSVSKGSKKGWVNLKARIKPQKGSPGAGQMDLSELRFTADVHSSGEIRNIQYSGNVMPDLGDNSDQMTPQMKEMIAQSYKMIPEAYKNSVFWFPEVPEDKLEIGDEFEVQRKTGMGGSNSAMQMETVSKQVFTLEDVSQDLAYFSVKQRSVTKTGGSMGTSSKTKIAGKGEAIFDLKQGMWLELTEKSRAKVQISGLAGMSDTSQDMNIILKYEMEQK